jgi:aminoglycoside 6'-N-acetyltransferase
VIARDGEVALRRMRDDEADYRLLARWLTDERVLAFYEGRDNPHPYERIVEKYRPRARGEEFVRPCIQSHEGRDVGYVQYYPVASPDDCGLEEADDTWGVDLFIGEPELWGKGIGTRALAALVRHLFAAENARRVVLDPHVDNQRAIRSYERCGFRKVKLLPEHEPHEGKQVDCWLMMIGREPGG